MPRNQVYYCICGGPFFEPSARDDEPQPNKYAPDATFHPFLKFPTEIQDMIWDMALSDDESKDWLTRVVLLTTGHDAPDEGGIKVDTYRGHAYAAIRGLSVPNLVSVYSKHRVLHFPAEYDDGRGFPILTTGELAKAMEIDSSGNDALYFPLHEQCLEMVHCYINPETAASQDAVQTGPNEGISSINQLWKVLISRMRGSECEYILPEPHDYYGGRFCRNVYWEPEDDYEGYGELLEASPMEMTILTERILGNLQPQCEASETLIETDSTGDEVRQGQDWWCEALVNKKRLPWLWDLDSEIVREKQRNGKWDWELLVRNLARPEIYMVSDSTLSLPLGLRNRRRIWRCIEEARVGDRELPEFDRMGSRNNWGELQDVQFSES